MKSLYWHIIGITLLTVLGFWLRFSHLDAINLYNDEFYQFETAVGYLETGEFKRYDFITQQVGESYTRAKIYTWQIAQSLKLFGYNEFAARLPSVVWGTLLIPLLIVFVLQTLKNPFIAYATATLIVFDDFFIEMARFTRMYSMFFVLSIVVLWCSWLFFTHKRKRWLFATLGIVALLINGLIFKELAMALVVGIGGYIAWRSIGFTYSKHPSDRIYWLASLAGLGGVCAALIVHFTVHPFIPLSAAIIRLNPHFSYFGYVVDEWHVPVAAAIFSIISFTSLKSVRKPESFFVIVTSIILLYFVFFSHRWDAKRYIGFILPLCYIIINLGIWQTSKLTLHSLSQWRSYVPALAILLFAIAGPWLSFPGVPAVQAITQTTYADRRYLELDRANLETAYNYVSDHYKTGETIFVQDPASFYWPDSNLKYIDLGEDRLYTYKQFIENINESDEGGWIIYTKRKQGNLRKDIRKYIEQNFEYIEDLSDTNVLVHHFK